MANNKIFVGLDVGTTKICTVCGQLNENKKPEIIGVGLSPTAGLRKGLVIDIEETISSIAASLEEAERMAGQSISEAIVSLDGAQVSFITSKGVIAVSKPSGEITEEDVARAIEAARAVSLPPNSEILHVIPYRYTIDGQSDVADPIGMNGVRLEAEVHIITSSITGIKNLTKCVSQVGLDVEEFVLTGIAAADAVLTDKQKELGCILVDIGGATTSVACFFEGDLIYANTIPVGGGHITNDLAVGLRTSVDLAERIKIEYGFAEASEIPERDNIDFSELSPNEEGKVSRRHVAEIIEARMQEIVSMIQKELRNVSGVLFPAGVIITGGGSKLPGIIDLFKEKLKLPVQIGFPIELKGIVDKTDDPTYATGVGLVLWGISQAENEGWFSSFKTNSVSDKIKKIFKSLLP